MSSFSQFLNQLPFSPQRFRRPESGSEALKPVEPELAGITINVYELEVKEGSEDEEEGLEEILDHSISSAHETRKDVQEIADEVPISKSSLLNQLRYANIVLFCSKCKSEVPVCTLQYHRKRKQALQTLRYSSQCPPVTVRGLLRRRNKAMDDLKERSFAQGQFIRSIHKINVAFELLKNEVEGLSDVDQIAPIGRWREKDIKAMEKTLNNKMSLGVSRSRKSESDSSNTKCVYLDNFLESGKGVFLGIYQGYNGNYVTRLCMRELHKNIQKKLRHIWGSGPSTEHIKIVIQEAYQNIDRVQLIADEENCWNRWSGCSALTCFLVNGMMYIANEGNVQGLLIRENNTLRAVTSCHDLYNRKERKRVRMSHGVIVKTEKCALVNGVLETTRGLGNQGDWRLKACVINKPRLRVVSLKEEDKMLVLASEGLWKIFNHREILFLVNKFIRDALAVKAALKTEESLNTDEMNFLGVGVNASTKDDLEFQYFVRKNEQGPVDFVVPENVLWRANNPEMFMRRATVVRAEKPHPLKDTTQNMIHKKNCNQSEENDEDLQKLASIISVGEQSLDVRQEISRLLSKRLLKSALIAGAEMNNIVMVLLLKGFKIE